ncbi:major facilitator superfamily domain-containing protein [Whalleya microplaca]|nr:major facilitator superfamily domain-containing protein [Whalleya microplaca]
MDQENGQENIAGGILRRYWVVWNQAIVSFCLVFCTLGFCNACGVFQTRWAKELKPTWSAGDVSWIGTTQGALLNIVGIVSGPLYDKGYIKSLMISGLVFCVVGLVVTGFVEGFAWLLLIFGIVEGIGVGILYTPALAHIERHFSRERLSTAAGIVSTGGSWGGIFYSLLLDPLVQAHDLRWACIIFAAINGGLLLLPIFFVRPGEPRTQDPQPPLTPRRSWREAFRQPKFLVFSASLLALYIAVDVPFFFIPSFAESELRLSEANGRYLLAGLNGASLVGRLFFGWLGSYLSEPEQGIRRELPLFQLAVFACGVVVYSWSAVFNLAGAIVFAIIYGFFTGGWVALTSPCVQVICEGDEAIFGTLMGFVSFAAGIGYVIGSPTAAYMMITPAGYLGILKDKPQLLKNKPQLLKDKPQLLKNKPQLLKNKPQLLENKPQLLENKPQLLKNKPKLLKNKPQLLHQVFRILEERPEVRITTVGILEGFERMLRVMQKSMNAVQNLPRSLINSNDNINQGNTELFDN